MNSFIRLENLPPNLCPQGSPEDPKLFKQVKQYISDKEKSNKEKLKSWLHSGRWEMTGLCRIKKDNVEQKSGKIRSKAELKVINTIMLSNTTLAVMVPCSTGIFGKD